MGNVFGMCFIATIGVDMSHSHQPTTSYHASAMMAFPYKPIYGLPHHFNCSDDVRDKFNQCQLDAQQAWSVTIDDYVRACLEDVNNDH